MTEIIRAMLKIIRTNSENSDFIEMVKELDAFLKITDQDDHDFYNQFNNIDVIKHVVVVYKDQKPVGCGALKHFDNDSMEIKRMYVSASSRGLGIAPKILSELETWARELKYKKCVLETGERQVAAVKLYHNSNYKRMQVNYGQYKSVVNSLCFEKQL
jgi:GNAT superfamily N-acetyltransferase